MKILFDNNNFDEHICSICKPLWGFSAYLQEYKLLFDTGSNGRFLLKHMEVLSMDVKEIEYIFVSHSHWDHIGGLDSIIELNPDVTLFVPESLPKHLINDLKTLVKEVIICTRKPQQLLKGVYTTGLLGDATAEQSLVIDAKETKVITGCGHFGIQNITQVASKIIGKKIDFAIGGFHLLRSSEAEIQESINVVKALGVKKVLPTHCTGDKAIQMYKDVFGENCFAGGIGVKI
ncbi:MBL fold metallo-hydrolase [Sulfurimonas autotrophica]|uniref:Beta-lactamase domain protein n=1 Tax=Sulfurimonas autotrophica (strain ATCC BAA-671 / DSM 16294 / JCM 11897 / OK10) TaxID=563040 RepID=E0UQQ9_SULAO|nr:MBL fold metallo-hydrolase [Sulfurimonas autotrophica]ADN09931.1 beta-lactamase domain protein [Sulfurimonas autotrophica DSM 16294]